jgi:hypothetical protein
MFFFVKAQDAADAFNQLGLSGQELIYIDYRQTLGKGRIARDFLMLNGGRFSIAISSAP